MGLGGKIPPFWAEGGSEKCPFVGNARFGVGPSPAKPTLQIEAKGGPLTGFFDAAWDPPPPIGTPPVFKSAFRGILAVLADFGP